jgi:hypothetical protein
MRFWPLNSLYFVIFLVIGFFATLPFVLGVAGDLWWVSLPMLLAWTVVLWFWGVPFAAGTPDEAKAWSIPQKIGGTLIMLGESLVGGVLAVFLVGFLIQEWFATILAILIMAVVIFWFGRDPPKARLDDHAPAHERPATPEPAPTASNQVTLQQPPATLSEWFLHHVSLVLFVGFGALTVFDSLHRHSFALRWPAAAMTLTYAAFVWIHVVSPPKPGQAPPPLWYKVLATLITVVMTFVFLIVLAAMVEAIGEFWIWIVPPVGLLVLIIALNWRNPQSATKSGRQARHVVHGGGKHHDRIVS